MFTLKKEDLFSLKNFSIIINFAVSTFQTTFVTKSNMITGTYLPK